MSGLPAAGPAAGAYRVLLSDRVFRRLWLLTALLVGAGYAQFNATFPIYATDVAGLPPGVLGLAYGANMVTVVLVQLVVLRMLRGRRRSSGAAAAAVIWGATWAVVLGAGHLDPAAGAGLLIVAAVMFGVGETLVSPTLPAIVNDIAPDRLRGRYNAGSVLAYTTGFAAGPAVAGVALDHGLGTGLLVGLMATCGYAAVAAHRLALLPWEADQVAAEVASVG